MSQVELITSERVAIFKVRTGARYDVRNEGRVNGLIFVYLLILIIHVTKHAST